MIKSSTCQFSKKNNTKSNKISYLYDHQHIPYRLNNCDYSLQEWQLKENGNKSLLPSEEKNNT